MGFGGPRSSAVGKSLSAPVKGAADKEGRSKVEAGRAAIERAEALADAVGAAVNTVFALVAGARAPELIEVEGACALARGGVSRKPNSKPVKETAK